MSALTYPEKTRLNEAILEQLRFRLLDKDGPVIAPEGKMYMRRDPTNESLLGSIGPQPDPDFDFYQPPNSMGVVLLTTPDADGDLTLSLSGQFDLVHRYIPDLDDIRKNHLKMEGGEPTVSQTIPFCYKRHTLCFSGVPLSFKLPEASNTWAFPATGHSLEKEMEGLSDRLVGDPRLYKRCHLQDSGHGARFNLEWYDDQISTQADLNALVEDHIFEHVGEVLPYEVQLRARARKPPPSMSNVPNAYLLEIFLENKTTFETSKSFGMTKPYLLDAQFTVGLEAGSSHLLPHKLSPEEYRYIEGNGVPGYGLNTSVQSATDGVFVTNAMPVYELERLENPTPQQLGMSTAARFDLLAGDPGPVLDELLVTLDNYSGQWKDFIQELRDQGDDDEAAVSQKNLGFFLMERDRVEDGVELLKTNPELRRCFSWMNQSMRRAVVRQGKSFEEWRLFQIGFILTQIRGVYERCCPDGELSEDHLNHAEVLWFATGGGKTEAYLGLLVMGMLYERMHGRYYGPTGWMRFPLRMLSVQQFQRLSYVVAEANIIRQSEGLGGHPFTIGYFTGGGTPGSITRKEDDRGFFLPKMGPDKLEELKFVADCPYCDEEHSISVQSDVKASRIKHVCSNAECWSNTTAEAGKYGEGIRGELGIYISDDEVYRYLPTVMVGTVDKLANIALNYRFQMFFGGASHFCPDHGFSLGGKCIHYNLVELDNGEWDSAPCPASSRPRGETLKTLAMRKLPHPGISFMIQDELHLMAESMGNFDAHYESLLYAIQEAFGGRKPKVLAATATIKDVEHHVNHLYQRQARPFPAQGFKLGESFYTKVVLDPDNNDKPMVRRLFAGIMPMGTGPAVYRSTAKASRRYIQLIDDLIEALGDATTAPKTTVELGFDASKADNLKAQLGEFLSANMIYANSNPGMSDIAGFLEDGGGDEAPNYPFTQLSGDSSLDEIQDAILHMETRGPGDNPRQILANSVVSHGVDIAQLNFMVISKWTKSISEYMQVSARAGRIQPGLVLVLLDGKSVFESSVFSDFKDYHRFMGKLVESVPINRFSPNLLKRTLPGIISAWLTTWAPSTVWGKEAYKQGHKLRSALNDPAFKAQEELRQHIVKTLSTPGYHLPAFDQEVVDGFLETLVANAEDIVSILANTPPLDANNRLPEILKTNWGNAPMRSLRDIEAELAIKPRDAGYTELFDMLGR
jgi:hypothetical protein